MIASNSDGGDDYDAFTRTCPRVSPDVGDFALDRHKFAITRQARATYMDERTRAYRLWKKSD